MIAIDGSLGEGGGQILRSSLALSLITGQAFRMEKIRAGRAKPGLLRQHLTAVQAAAQVGGAQVLGAAMGSQELEFQPGRVESGNYHFAVGTAGSATLVLQTILPALILARGPSELLLEGGTHNPYAPPFDFLKLSFLPLLKRMGAEVQASLERPGFYPAGGGRLRVRIQPCQALQPLDLRDPGSFKSLKARALLAHLPPSIGDRELKTLSSSLDISESLVEILPDSQGPGNVLLLVLEQSDHTEVFTGFGEKGVWAESLAETLMEEFRQYQAADVPIGVHLADQLLLPLTLAGSGRFRTLRPSAHTTTNLQVIQQFLSIRTEIQPLTEDSVEIRLGSFCQPKDS